MNCLIYCRVSTEEQADKGYSLDAQEKLCRDFAERNGYSVASVYRDEGKSATNLDRSALQELLSRCTKEGSVDAVFVQETDRLARNTKDHLTIKAILQKSGVKLVSVAQPMLDDSPEGMMIDTILASVNQFQSDINSRKTRRGMQERFEQGWWPGPAPIGYVNVPIEGDLETGRSMKIIKRDPERWNLVREGLELYITGNHSADAVNDILYEKGLRSRNGNKLAHSVLVNALRNPFYAGLLCWNGQERIGRHEPMITLQEHKCILQIIDAHNQYACRRRKHDFLLRGFLAWHICGHRYTADINQVKRKAYYHCAARRTHSNRHQHVEVAVLEREVEELFRTIQFSEDFTNEIIHRLRTIHFDKKNELVAHKHILYNQKRAIEAKRDKAEEKLFEGVISDDDFGRVRAKFSQELAKIQEQIQRLDDQQDIDLDVVQEVLKLSRNVYHGYMTATPDLKRHYLGLFWSRFLVQDKKIVEAIPTDLILNLQRERKVMIMSEWLPGPPLIKTLQNHEYMTSLKQKLKVVTDSLPAN